MRSHSIPTAVLALGLLISLPVVTSAQLYSVEEAELLSKKSGRPIFAMAGNKT